MEKAAALRKKICAICAICAKKMTADGTDFTENHYFDLRSKVLLVATLGKSGKAERSRSEKLK